MNTTRLLRASALVAMAAMAAMASVGSIGWHRTRRRAKVRTSVNATLINSDDEAVLVGTVPLAFSARP